MSSTETIRHLRETMSEGVTQCTGVVPLEMNSSQLFYRNVVEGSLGFIDFSTAVSDPQLEHLVKACQPATFGDKQKDVLDESYRKAWKLDATNFAINFNPSNTGIIQAVHDSLLHPNSLIHVELYKLNVYGPGSFFKPHVDTPRSDTMFGSLVVVLPTKHEGGALLMRHHGREWIFNSSDLVSPKILPQVAFASFFSDVEHEVTMVKSGYRVTLTYNLYFGDVKPNIVPSVLPDNTELKIKKSLIKLLNDKQFLPTGGLLGFGLSHLYPIDPKTTKLHALKNSLKGTDAVIKRACDRLSLPVSPKVIYKSSGYHGMACLLNDMIVSMGQDEIDEDIAFYLRDRRGGLLVNDMDIEPTDYFDDVRSILWLKPLEKYDIETPYVAYGNEASLDYAYGEICLVVEVEAVKDRRVYH